MNQYFILLILITVITLIFIYYKLDESTSKQKKSEKTNIITISFLSIIAACLIIGSALIYVYILIERKGGDYGDFSKIGPYGDLIGGILNPVVAFVGIMAAFLAFYVQYTANKQVQEQFNLQKFESQFYEMIRMHRENLNEMKIEGYKFDSNFLGIKSKKDKITSGKKVFVTLDTELKAIYTILNKEFDIHYSSRKLNTLEVKSLLFKEAYSVFFAGVTSYEIQVKNSSKKDNLFDDVLLKKFVKELKEIRKGHENRGKKEIPNYKDSNTLWLSFNYRPFSGHQSLLAHYYRHLFQTVKFVVKQDENFISYEKKRDYLRMLRSMLSNKEQLLLYYNWLAGHGDAWEIKRSNLNKKYSRNNKGNKFFTDYRMIHNIPSGEVIEDFDLEKIFNEEYRDFRYEENRKEEDTLFELIGIISNYK
ncbi:hypothetical protein E0W68_05690 [Flavobacterium salilacus subsp. salilacus]|uniref:putative phage abortive infection protein n=1 Tax=Flavobacterium TaxID=237 RepID=UPI001074B8D3|nr:MULTISPECIES: putative phage abortive infection protein [Flavobacterium]KAF2519259.1 hypothetical protein E0W68_05690 [Flavobacterium salilacus subsp. salilacus]MBE1613443.1 hypothetical protein [Flavobacterium sp. SaA2.13]